MGVSHEPKPAAYTCFPLTLSTRTTAEVFLLMFFLPSGVSVERHVWHCSASGGAVRHDTLGTLPEVPVPKKIKSTAGFGFCWNCWHAVGMSRRKDERSEGFGKIYCTSKGFIRCAVPFSHRNDPIVYRLLPTNEANKVKRVAAFIVGIPVQ